MPSSEAGAEAGLGGRRKGPEPGPEPEVGPEPKKGSNKEISRGRADGSPWHATKLEVPRLYLTHNVGQAVVRSLLMMAGKRCAWRKGTWCRVNRPSMERKVMRAWLHTAGKIRGRC